MSRKKQADEEFQLIKGLANSINDRCRKKQKLESKKDDALQMFGCYVTETLTALEPQMKHLAQHHINNILFQAQMGSLGQEPHAVLGQTNIQPNKVHNQCYNRPTSSPNVGPNTSESNLSQFHINSWLTNQSSSDSVARRSPVNFGPGNWVEDHLRGKTYEELH